jgi:uncharacterized Fe-S cluster protein YjdI
MRKPISVSVFVLAHRKRLMEIGNCMHTYGETICGTRKSWIKPDAIDQVLILKTSF